MEINKEGLKDEALDPALKTEAKTGEQGETAEQKLAKLEAEKIALEERLKKSEQDKDNYRVGLLSEKAKKIDLFETKPAYQPPYQPEKKIDEYGNAIEEEDKITPQVEKVLAQREERDAKQNQTIALKRWMQTHPELADDALRGSVLDEFVSRSGKSVEGISEDLNRAYGYYKFSRGISETKPETKPAAPAFNPGSSTPSDVSGGYSQGQKEFMSESNITPEQFEAMKTRILDGTLNLGDDVKKIILGRNY